MNSNRRPEDPKTPVPAYIVTFSDMITLLLTFFVLLISLAEKQDELLFKQGQSSFKNAVADFGLSGMLFSKARDTDFDFEQVKHNVNRGKDDRKKRSIDAQTEMMRRTIMDMEQQMQITPTQITASSKTLTVPEIHFKKSSWALDESAKKYLKTYCSELKDSSSGDNLIIYIVGLARNERGQKQKWVVSANRASQAADFMRGALGGEVKWPVYSWGAGPGGDWTGPGGVLSKDASIMIAILNQE